MREILPDGFERYRRVHPTMGATPRGVLHGFFEIHKLRIISSGRATSTDIQLTTSWEHVSVSTKNRCPTWAEMQMIKDVFWLPEELVLQFHPPQSVYVNTHENCLHLWRGPTDVQLPPFECV